jgi:APA family basic amino acid/polyamine antiporter
MASHDMLPRSLAKVNRFGAPAAGLVATGLFASAMVLMNYSKSLVEGFTFLTLVVTAANLPMYLCCALALVVLWKRGDRPASSDLLVLGLLGSAYTVFAFFGMGREPFLWGLALAAVGVPLFAWLRQRRGRVPSARGTP